ncbi:C-type lectin [Plakobranchus ocellatus]|uniref:C-type lectin n=1 Tax=Plakobranchus ocellatus TaxID=259542 RepID=A0AAV4A726_9GAST|nr:C-type lectin [Plakobranchus ocellatus]
MQVNSLPLNYQYVAGVTAFSNLHCGIQCERSPSCDCFLFNVTSLSCILLGSGSPTEVLNLQGYLDWEFFTLQTACPCKQYLEQFGKCIQINTNVGLNWHQAQTACQDDGGSLMIIDSDQQFGFFKQMFDDLLVGQQFFHLGARRIGAAKEDMYWEYREAVTYQVKSSYFADRKPDNVGGVEDCLASRPEDNFDLNDVGCDDYYGFYICEYFKNVYYIG